VAARFANVKAIFIENRVIKLMALLLATITIYAIQSVTNQLDEFEVPIVVNVDEGVAVLKQDAKTAYITCRGSREDLRRLDVSQLKVVVAPKETGVAGGERVPIGPRNVQGWTRGVQIVKIRPGVVSVNFDREIEKQVGVAKPETVGKPLLGRAEIDYEPKIVTIRGPQSKLVDRKILRTEPIDVDGAVDSFSKEVRIRSEGESGVWEVEPAEVTVQVSIVTEAVSKEWQDLEVVAMMNVDCGRDYAISPKLVDVSLLGSPQAVKRISAKDISVFVDCAGIREAGVHKVPAAVHLPPGVNLSAAVQPPVIEVTVIERRLPKEPPVESKNIPDSASEESPAAEAAVE
jgi:hypothetical protein